MSIKLNEFAEHLSEDSAARFDDVFAEMEADSRMTDEAQQRILSSVMRKTGLEMNRDITITKKEKDNETTGFAAEVVHSARGVAVAACLAVAAVGVIGAAVLLGGGVETAPLKQQDSLPIVTTTSDTSESQPAADGIAVPDVSGMDADEAGKALEDAGFVPVKRDKYDDSVPAGKVIGTEPGHGDTLYEKGTEVQYFVSLGPMQEKVEVPNVVGMRLNEATELLEGLGLSCMVEYFGQEGEEGYVYEQSIAAGETVDKGAAITLYVPDTVDTESVTTVTEPAPDEDATDIADEEPNKLTMEIPMPDGVRGWYVIDVYLDGNVAYTKSIMNAETLAGGKVSIDLMGIGRQSFAIYIRCGGLDGENYIHYADYEVDFDTGEIELQGKLNEEELLKATPAGDETAS